MSRAGAKPLKLAGVVAVHRRVVACWAGLLLASASASCGGGPEGLHDGAENKEVDPVASPAPAAPATSGDSPVAQPADCWNVAEGCHCTTQGEVVTCQGRRYNFGDYVTCAGERECVNGAWGPCIATHFVTK